MASQQDLLAALLPRINGGGFLNPTSGPQLDGQLLGLLGSLSAGLSNPLLAPRPEQHAPSMPEPAENNNSGMALLASLTEALAQQAGVGNHYAQPPRAPQPRLAPEMGAEGHLAALLASLAQPQARSAAPMEL